MKHIILVLAMVFGFNGASAQSNTAADDRFRAVITHQLQAIAQDDAVAAYAEAAPNVQRVFPSPEIFMNMVRRGYPPVYRNKQYGFGEAGVDSQGRPFQRVDFIGMDGLHYEGIYFMEQQPDGAWKISGVVMARAPESDA